MDCLINLFKLQIILIHSTFLVIQNTDKTLKINDMIVSIVYLEANDLKIDSKISKSGIQL